jgi:hypothetical protein
MGRCVRILGLIVCLAVAGFAVDERAPGIPRGAKLYIAPMNGYETFIAAALHKKEVPVVVVTNRELAEFEIVGASESQKAGWARVVFTGNRGSDEEASISVIDLQSSAVVFAYNVNKQGSVRGRQSSAEACAKHLKNKIEDDEKITRKSGVPVRSAGPANRATPSIPSATASPTTLADPAVPAAPVQPVALVAGRPSATQPRAPQPPAAAAAALPAAPAVSPANVQPVPQVAPAPTPAAPTLPVAHLIRIVCPEKVLEVPFSSSRVDRRKLACDEPITIVSESANWIRVKTADGVEGNVAPKFIAK